MSSNLNLVKVGQIYKDNHLAKGTQRRIRVLKLDPVLDRVQVENLESGLTTWLAKYRFNNPYRNGFKLVQN